MQNGGDAVLPSSCPGTKVCGTHSPVWLDQSSLNNNRDYDQDIGGKEVVEGEACVSWAFPNGQHDCCLFTLPVRCVL